MGADPEVPLRNKKTCAEAAENGHLAVLLWARAQGCPWDEETCSYAAYGGQLAVLQWARAERCPYDGETYAEAARGEHPGATQWARGPEGAPGTNARAEVLRVTGHSRTSSRGPRVGAL